MSARASRTNSDKASCGCREGNRECSAMASTVNDDRLTDELVCRVMGWRVAPGRFIKSGRSWIPRWRFQPLRDLAAALDLLERAAERFCLTSDRGTFTAQVHIGDRCGTAAGGPTARTVTMAICRALGMEI